MRIVVCGVSGSGKSVVGKCVAASLGCPFLDADDFHSEANKAKMHAHIPLTDEDRWPWLDAMNAALRDKPDVVLACSALKRVYRDRLEAGLDDFHWVGLVGDRDLLYRRMENRKGHFMPPELLDSQLATWEPLERGQTFDVAGSVDEICTKIVSEIKQG